MPIVLVTPQGPGPQPDGLSLQGRPLRELVVAPLKEFAQGLEGPGPWEEAVLFYPQNLVFVGERGEFLQRAMEEFYRQGLEALEVGAGIYFFQKRALPPHPTGPMAQLFNTIKKSATFPHAPQDQLIPIQSLEDLQRAEHALRKRKLKALMAQGVRFLDAPRTYIHDQVVFEGEATVYPSTFIEGPSFIGLGATIWPGNFIKNSSLGSFCQVKPNCLIEDSSIGPHCSIGPMAHIRPETSVGQATRIGNFVELKKSTIGPNVRICHLSYVGDSTVGENSNLGCGLITCNYDGEKKHQTTIGKNCFIGSDSQIVAPLSIGDDSYVACGSTITKDLPPGSFAVARARQITKPSMAKRFLKGKNSACAES